MTVSPQLLTIGPQLGALIVLGGVLFGLAFVVSGVFTLVGAAKRLSQRFDEPTARPILAVIEETQRKLDAAQYAVGTFPSLVERARLAVLEIERARERLRNSADAVNAAARFVGSLFAKI